MKFSIKLLCKPYVKRFMEMNYGEPCDFTKDLTLYPMFRKKLEKTSTRHDNVYNLSLKKYSEIIEIKITRDDFYKYGWELSITDTIAFNREIEGRVKLFMYLIVSTRLGFGMSIVDSIRYFQERFNFPEDVWPKESIVKDCQRNLTVQKNEIIEQVSQLIDNIVIEKLSGKKTTFHKINKNYGSAQI